MSAPLHPHVVTEVLPALALHEAAALDAQNPIPVLRTLCRYDLIIDFKTWTYVWRDPYQLDWIDRTKESISEAKCKASNIVMPEAKSAMLRVAHPLFKPVFGELFPLGFIRNVPRILSALHMPHHASS
jgi:hypothetical protein